MNHATLVARALNWVRTTMKYKLAVMEPPGNLECPDVIGFRHMGQTSIVVECKASRSDFLKDLKKPGRKPESASLGMGSFRYYFAPATGIIFPNDLPAGWGLAVMKGTRVRILRQAVRFTERNIPAEALVLFVMAQRATEGWGRKIFGSLAPAMTDGDPHPATFRILKNLREQLKKTREAHDFLVARNDELMAILAEHGIKEDLS